MSNRARATESASRGVASRERFLENEKRPLDRGRFRED